MGLRLKFNLVMAAAMVVGLGLATLFTARFLEQNARDEVMREASLMAAQAAAVRCHSTPAEAPQTMVDLYGAANGFAWPFNEVIGAQIVSIPTAVATNRANRLMVLYVGALAAVFAVVIVIVNVLLQYVIIGPVRRISAAATDVSMGNMDAPEVEIKGGDEIASLSESFNRMRRSLANALKMLG